MSEKTKPDYSEEMMKNISRCVNYPPQISHCPAIQAGSTRWEAGE